MKWECCKCEKLINKNDLIISGEGSSMQDYYYHSKCWKNRDN